MLNGIIFGMAILRNSSICMRIPQISDLHSYISTQNSGKQSKYQWYVWLNLRQQSNRTSCKWWRYWRFYVFILYLHVSELRVLLCQLIFVLIIKIFACCEDKRSPVQRHKHEFRQFSHRRCRCESPFGWRQSHRWRCSDNRFRRRLAPRSAPSANGDIHRNWTGWTSPTVWSYWKSYILVIAEIRENTSTDARWTKIEPRIHQINI